ncbi:MAG: ROK family protein [Sphaerochaetaceae bacterium]
MRFTQPTAARALNRLRTLNLIATNDNLSRADVARLLKLNKVSTSEIVDLLIKENLISEKEFASGSVGRPPTPLQLNKDSQMVLAFDINSRTTSVALVNLKGELLRFERQPTPLEPKAEEIAASIINLANKFGTKIKESSIIKGLALSLNAQVESSTGTVTTNQDWNWNSVPLSYALSKHLKYPIIIENSVKAMVLGQRWFGSSAEKESTLYVNWAEEIQVAFLDQGKILLHDSLIAHIPVANSGTCRCKAIGCLETQAAGWAFLENYPEASSLKGLNTLAESNSAIDTDLLSGSDYLALALIYVAALLKPKKIIISTAFSDRYFLALKTTFFRKAPKELKENTVIEKTHLGEQAGILGTAALALDEFIFRRTLLEQIKSTSL